MAQLSTYLSCLSAHPPTYPPICTIYHFVLLKGERRGVEKDQDFGLDPVRTQLTPHSSGF